MVLAVGWLWKVAQDDKHNTTKYVLLTRRIIPMRLLVSFIHYLVFICVYTRVDIKCTKDSTHALLSHTLALSLSLLRPAATCLFPYCITCINLTVTF